MFKSKPLAAYEAAELIALLALWQHAGLISALDLAFARFLLNNSQADLLSTQSADSLINGTNALQINEPQTNKPQINSSTLLLAALLSHQVGRGHVCLPLAQLLSEPQTLLNTDTSTLYTATGEVIPTPLDLLTGLNLPQLYSGLAQSGAVLLADHTPTPSSAIWPLVLHGDALYLYRYWYYEQQIAADLRALMQSTALPDMTKLDCWLNELFPALSDEENATGEVLANTSADLSTNSGINWQKLACVNTLRSQFSVITGGPGTGKTYTVVRLLALLQRLAAEQATTADPSPLVIKLAAPTGKAAARLKESIQAAADTLKALPAAWQDAITQISAESATLHKLLGVQAGTRQFKHHRANPLALDVLIVDEASMVDIELMQALLAALPVGARLILLGDKDQLASVEAGAVLGQLCDGAEQGGYRADTFAYLQQFCAVPLPQWLQQPAGPAHLQHVVMLRVSRRFTASSGIGALAKAVNQAALPELKALFASNRFTDIRLLQNTQPDSTQIQNIQPDNTQSASSGQPDNRGSQEALLHALKALCQQGFAAYWQAIVNRPAADCSIAQQDNWARAVLKAYQGFQLLTPVREGPFGVAGLNMLVQKALSFLPAAKESSGRHDSWYEGRPVMITANDYNLNLRNGDIGMVLTLPADGQKRAVFIDSDNQVRWILPSRLTEVETVFAMTVHKSQGSEFAHTVMVLPERDNPVLSRELIYTGITRAAKQLTLVVPNWQVLQESVSRKTVRAGSLRI